MSSRNARGSRFLVGDLAVWLACEPWGMLGAVSATAGATLGETGTPRSRVALAERKGIDGVPAAGFKTPNGSALRWCEASARPRICCEEL